MNVAISCSAALTMNISLYMLHVKLFLALLSPINPFIFYLNDCSLPLNPQSAHNSEVERLKKRQIKEEYIDVEEPK